MGVLNVTPDSFSDGGKYLKADVAVCRAREMAAEGADIIDIGGESSRPGAERVSCEEEIKRVLPVIKALKVLIDIPLSIDTYKLEVAEIALKEGVEVVNDITALSGDLRMAGIIASNEAGIILMHMKGTPQDMQDEPKYDDVIEEIYEYLAAAVEKAGQAGISSDKIVIDPGIGFGKRQEDNLRILRDMKRFKKLNKPILIGASRKSFIGNIIGKKEDDRVYGTLAACTAAIMNGADIVRVHDVNAMRDTARVVRAIMEVE